MRRFPCPIEELSGAYIEADCLDKAPRTYASTGKPKGTSIHHVSGEVFTSWQSSLKPPQVVGKEGRHEGSYRSFPQFEEQGSCPPCECAYELDPMVQSCKYWSWWVPRSTPPTTKKGVLSFLFSFFFNQGCWLLVGFFVRADSAGGNQLQGLNFMSVVFSNVILVCLQLGHPPKMVCFPFGFLQAEVPHQENQAHFSK